MEAYELIIDSKRKTSPFNIVSVDDFQTRIGQTVDPHIILEHSNVSLYCVDQANHRAIFVETAPNVDVFQAPFYFLAQYEQAQKLIAVPYETLHALAKKVDVSPRRIILLYSTGRCGSTLMSHVMNLTPSIVSFSEPDVFSQLVMIRTAFGHKTCAGTDARQCDAPGLLFAQPVDDIAMPIKQVFKGRNNRWDQNEIGLLGCLHWAIRGDRKMIEAL